MPGFRRLPSLPTILLLLAAFVVSPALETHEQRGHLSDAGVLNDGSVYLAGHTRADDSLHIESLGSIESLHCVGCLMRQNRSGLVIRGQLTAHRVVGTSLSTLAGNALPTDPTRFSGAPRAPPGLRPHSS
ncbi:MAG: hypothetical protein OES47_04625 [Acidobacteriota bacterium]|nr:hypothetical protein [Acidobacteriota bacterium]